MSHYDWDLDIVANSTKYDQAIWSEVYSPIVWKYGKWYSLTCGAVYTFNLNEMTKEAVYTAAEFQDEFTGEVMIDERFAVYGRN